MKRAYRVPPPDACTLLFNQVPQLPEVMNWPSTLRWIVMVMNHDDPQLHFAASCLAYALKNGRLTERQFAACQKLFVRIHKAYLMDELNCQWFMSEDDFACDQIADALMDGMRGDKALSGTINIARAIFDNTVFHDEPKTEREAWIWLIAEASWKARVRRIGNAIVQTERGELAASVRFLAGAWKWSAPKVQRYLERLKKAEMIRSKTDTGVTILTICNYDDYQAQPQSSDTAPIQHRYSTDTNEKKDEIREKEGRKDIPSSEAEKPDLPSEKEAPNGDASQTDFEKFWAVYPKKASRKEAEKAFARALKSGVALDELIRCTERYAKSVESKDPTFVKHASGWLNGERWKDWPDEPPYEEDANIRWLRETRLRYEALDRRIAAGEEI